MTDRTLTSTLICKQCFLIFCLFHLFLAVPGLRCYRAFPGCGQRGLLSSCGAWASHCSGFSCCGAQALGLAGSSCGSWAWSVWLLVSRVQAQELWLVGLVAPQHAGSSWIRDQTHVMALPLSHQGSLANNSFKKENYF